MQPVEIGAREIYDELVKLGAKFEEFRSDHKVLEHRVSKLEKDNDASSEKGWRVKLATYSAMAGLAAAVAVDLIGRI